MTEGMMEAAGMMWGVGLIGFLVIAALLLTIAALIKYLFFDGRRQQADD